MCNPNVMLDLQAIAKKDRDPSQHSKLKSWHLEPTEPPVNPAFRFWVDRPVDLVSIVQGTVKKIYEVMDVPGGR